MISRHVTHRTCDRSNYADPRGMEGRGDPDTVGRSDAIKATDIEPDSDWNPLDEVRERYKLIPYRK